MDKYTSKEQRNKEEQRIIESLRHNTMRIIDYIHDADKLIEIHDYIYKKYFSH
jgi:hypothetical protein